MKSTNLSVSSLLMLAGLLAACQAPPSADTMEEPAVIMTEPTPTAALLSQPASTPEVGLENTATPSAGVSLPGWYGVSLTDARTGEAFTINDFQGKVVLVETMAVWCSKCYDQQLNIQWMHDQLGGRDDFVSLSLDIDPFEDLAYLQNYLANNNFPWRYAVAPVEVARELAALYGDQFLNPPSTPILLIDRHGTAHPLPFGLKSVDDLLRAVQPFLDEGA